MVYYKKKGFPGLKDIVLCKVKKILPHSVFVELLEYDNLEGMIHISELSKRWTKNINEIVSLNSVIVCRVENINESKGYIDLSKKRVTSGEEKSKKDEAQKENHVEKIIEHVLKKNGISLKDFYEKQGYALLEEYGSLQSFYESCLEDSGLLEDLNFSKKIINELKESFDAIVQKSRITEKKIIKFYANGENGLDNLKKFAKELVDFKQDDIVAGIKYLNSPEYLVSINSSTYKKAGTFFENLLKRAGELSQKYGVTLVQ
ncbi:MAG: S1 RNA-binding domain-containing protein [Candidatus Nanoarchaeia archaeon]|nr:S1 RNA-binding domain-containing protein [Candidatus Nanoarchaeia archaeon]MDD5053914.1 S1 RNA-binding domain-containing protein [Candidatus Nanoarchaeia archaeon]